MSGSLQPPIGDRCTHIEAARDWLNRAEEQFAGGDNLLASATLMLAQAELKLMVESVVAGACAPGPRKSDTGFRLARTARTAVGIAALAASLMVGIFLGRVLVPNTSTPSGTAGPVQIVQGPPVTPATPGTPTEQVEVPSTSPGTEEGPTAVMSAELPQPEPANPPRHRRSVLSPSPAPEPVGATQPSPAAQEPDASAPTSRPHETIQPSPPIPLIHPAELALRTILALSERMLEGEKQQ
jgi:hypothetical protein